MTTGRLSLLVVAAAGLLSGCSDLLTSSERRGGEIVATVTGHIDSESPLVSVPDSVGVNHLFPVTIRTVYGCNVRPGRTKTETTRLNSTITPHMDWRYSRNCPDRGLGIEMRQVYIRFRHQGTGVITVVGLDGVSWPPFEPPGDTVRVYRTVQVVRN